MNPWYRAQDQLNNSEPTAPYVKARAERAGRSNPDPWHERPVA